MVAELLELVAQVVVVTVAEVVTELLELPIQVVVVVVQMVAVQAVLVVLEL